MSLHVQPVDLSTAPWEQATSDATAVEGGFNGLEENLVAPLEALTSTEGTGISEVLVNAIRKHLQEEYSSQRIVGEEYSAVCLGALSAIMQASNEFLFNQQQVNVLNTEISFLRQETIAELALTDDNLSEALGFNHISQERKAIDEVDCYRVPVPSTTCTTDSYAPGIPASTTGPAAVPTNHLLAIIGSGIIVGSIFTISGGSGSFTWLASGVTLDTYTGATVTILTVTGASGSLTATDDITEESVTYSGPASSPSFVVIFKSILYETSTTRGEETFVWYTYDFDTNTLTEINRYKQLPVYAPVITKFAMMLVGPTTSDQDVLISDPLGGLEVRDETTVNGITLGAVGSVGAFMSVSYGKWVAPLETARIDGIYYIPYLCGNVGPDVWVDSYVLKYNGDGAVIGAKYIEPYGNYQTKIAVNETHIALVEEAADDILKVYATTIADGEIATTAALVPVRTKTLDSTTLVNTLLALDIAGDFVYFLIEAPATTYTAVAVYNWVTDEWTQIWEDTLWPDSIAYLAWSISYYDNNLYVTSTQTDYDTINEARAMRFIRDPNTLVWTHDITNVPPLDASLRLDLTQIDVMR